MDAKVTLSFNQSIIEKAKTYAEQNNISLSRLVEFLLKQTTSGDYQSLEEIPIADWVNMVSEGTTEYQTKPKSRKDLKNDYYSSKK
ncbi:MAG: hypothetical protein BGO31_09505 [Bacteroidetes bacterium 43-16]|nr:MAG: hypothetical protein BGO31_09505 [Bacteroidetes bacterium 43-16]